MNGQDINQIKKHFKNFTQIASGKKGENFPDFPRVIMGFNGWLRGIHHHAAHLQSYVDEYTYRFNRNFIGKGLFENLLTRMMACKPHTYKVIIS